MRRILAPALLLLALAPAAAWAQDDSPFVDVVEIAGVIDARIEQYALERIDAAEREGARLLVFQLDSLGGMKVSDGELLPPLVRRIRDARIPVGVFVGPRSARAAGMALFMAQAAHVSGAEAAARLGPVTPIDLGHVDRSPVLEQLEALPALGLLRGRSVVVEPERVYDARTAVEVGLVDMQVVSLADMLDRLDGRAVTTAVGEVTLSLPTDAIDVRFHQPGPIRRLLHAFSNATLVYLMLLAGAMLLIFELFQPGFGVAGVTAGLFFAASAYGLTVLPARVLGMGLLIGGLLLLALDVARDSLGPPTVLGGAGLIAGSLTLFPSGHEPLAIPGWIVGLGVAGSLIVAVPVMTVVRRARRPIATELKRKLVGEPGQVRSLLNPEGFIEVGDEIWRARSEDGSRMRVGEQVVVTGVVGTVLMVRAPVADDAGASDAGPGEPAET